MTGDDFRDYQAAGLHVAPFLDACMAAIDWSQCAVVGFSATFQQTMPSLCLARRIKQLRPETKIVFGGAACQGPMGIELLRLFPSIDYVFLGEADITFAPLVEQILDGGPVHPAPGVIGRQSPGAVLPPACGDLPAGGETQPHLVRDLDQLPYPDFDDYFARLRSSPLAAGIEPLLFHETSRGCWWGEKHHCAFCGLNGQSLAYRSKSPQRAVDELRWLVDRHGVRRSCAADNIFDYRHFDTLLPMLRDEGVGLKFECELKANLTRRQVQQLLDAGLGAAQLGIETFITPVLKLAGKGANAIQNLQTLKWFSEAGIEVKWNFLYGFPREDPADYARLLDIPAVAGSTWSRRWPSAAYAWTGSLPFSRTLRTGAWSRSVPIGRWTTSIRFPPSRKRGWPAISITNMPTGGTRWTTSPQCSNRSSRGNRSKARSPCAIGTGPTAC